VQSLGDSRLANPKNLRRLDHAFQARDFEKADKMPEFYPTR